MIEGERVTALKYLLSFMLQILMFRFICLNSLEEIMAFVTFFGKLLRPIDHANISGSFFHFFFF